MATSNLTVYFFTKPHLINLMAGIACIFAIYISWMNIK